MQQHIPSAWLDAEARARGRVAPSVEKAFRIIKAEPDQQIVYGWGSVAIKDGEEVTDLQGDQIDPATLEQAVTDFMLEFGNHGGTGMMHEGKPVGDIIASLVTTPAIVQAFFPGATDVPIGWILGVKVNDPDVWARVKSGELRAFSIQGTADRVPAQQEAA